MKRLGSTVRQAMLAGLMAAAFAGPAFAQQQLNTGLGSAWPTDTPDVSQVPGFHAYAWVKSGVKYVQINDAAGNVLVAVATADGIFLPLPMGRSAKSLQTPLDGTTTTGTSAGIAIYQDDSVRITATPQDNAPTVFKAEATCTNPVECTTHVNSN